MTKFSIRCAIYTRKSVEEGLDQEFNSLDAQYDACENYIASQRHEGWKQVKERYDDGGVSGGTLNRPGLERLLAEVDAGRIQMIVVYKIDRLTRSLADFAKLIERLEAQDCSFVSVTQSFNTSSSMGRLTLNVLLSFAQFEREVTAERIRDKIAASKKKGLWMGGLCPLGYDRHPDSNIRTLIINKSEADRVEKLFTLYDTLQNLRDVELEAEKLGLRSKRRIYRNGKIAGDRQLSRGQIYHILRNPIYRGQIRHKDQIWPGKHQAIIGEELWSRVQEKLEQSAARERGRGVDGNSSASKSFLAGKLFDDTGDRLTPTHSVKNGRRFRYYVSNRLISGGRDETGWRLSASALESKVAQLVAGHLRKRATRIELTNDPAHGKSSRLNSKVETLISEIKNEGSTRLPDLIQRLRLGERRLGVKLSLTSLAESLEVLPDQLAHDTVQFDSTWTIKRRGVEAKMIIGDLAPEPDIKLIRLLSVAHGWLEKLKAGVPLKSIAISQNVTPTYIRQRLKIAFLSPTIQRAIVAGELAPEFTTNRIVRMKIPRNWQHQNSLFGL